MICIDSSVVAKLFLREVQTDHARALFYGTLAEGLPVVAPSLLLFELTNIVRQQMRRGGTLPVDEANELLLPSSLSLFSSTRRLGYTNSR